MNNDEKLIHNILSSKHPFLEEIPGSRSDNFAEYKLDICLSDNIENIETNEMVTVLLAKEVSFINTKWYRKDLPEERRKDIQLSVICNDIFAWAAADAENCELDDIKEIYKFCLNYGIVSGPIYWCIKKRGEYPQKPVLETLDQNIINTLGDLKPNSYDNAWKKLKGLS